MRAIVSGCAGFIGSHLCERLLNDGYEVIGIDDLSAGFMVNLDSILTDKRFVFIQADILKMSPWWGKKKVDIVFHFAANSDISSGDSDIEMKRTFLTTYKILCAMRDCNIGKIVFPSSGSVYGESREMMKEDHPLNPISHYAAAKLASESFISSFCSMNGIQAWICRLPNVVGEHATHGAILDFIKRIDKNPEVLKVLGNGSQTKPYMYVKDCIDAILFVANNAGENLNIYNIAGIGQTSVKEIAEMVVAGMGTNTKIVYEDSDRGWKGDSPYYKPDIRKLIALGYMPTGYKMIAEDSNKAVNIAVKKIIDERTIK